MKFRLVETLLDINNEKIIVPSYIHGDTNDPFRPKKEGSNFLDGYKSDKLIADEIKPYLDKYGAILVRDPERKNLSSYYIITNNFDSEMRDDLPYRVTEFEEDEPVGHMSKSSIDQLILHQSLGLLQFSVIE